MSVEGLEYRPLMPEDRGRGIGLCGAGGIVNDAHLPAYAKAGFRVVGIYDRQPAKAAETAARYHIPRVFDSLEQLAADDEVQIVDVAVPATQNEAVVDAVSAYGKPMLLQKPLAEDWDTARRLVDLLEERGVTAAVNQQMRWEPGIRACRGLLQQGALGELYNIAFLIFVDTPWHLWGWLKEKPTIDVLYHSIHYIDAIRFLSGGQVQSFYCDGSSLPGYDARGETRLCLHLRMAGQLRASILTNHHAAYGIEGQQSEFRVEGTEGMVRRTMGLLMDYPKGVPDTFSYKAGGAPWRDVAFDATWFPDAFVGPMASLMCALEGSIERPETDVRDNLETLRLVFAAYESMATGQTVKW